MSYGLIVRNTSGEIQIDGENKNFSLLQTGTIDLPSGGGTGVTYANLAFVNTVVAPLIGLKLSTSFFCVNHNYNSLTQSNVFADNATQIRTIPFIIFKQANSSDIPTSGYGFVIKNSSNEVVFHSALHWLKIISFNRVPRSDIFSLSSYSDKTVVDADNNYFILTPSSLMKIGYNPYIPANTMGGAMMKKINSTTVRVQVRLFGYDAPTDYSVGNYAENFNLIEVNKS
jgi:hypothetical protein